VEICGKVDRIDLKPASGWTEAGSRILRSENHCAIAATMGACSACAGDYENPDRTARPPDDGDDSEDAHVPDATEEEFPAD
jgi:hypothetical protein